jgi:TRAP-type mannitol/chloroaromatic compound transport system substrate-binding protein
MHESVTVSELLVNGDVWKSLAPDIQEIVRSAAMETFIRWWARWQRQNSDALKELQEKHNVQILKTPEEIMTAFLQTWDKIAQREAEKDPFFKKVLESQKEYASIVVPAKRFMFPPYDFAANYYWPAAKK